MLLFRSSGLHATKSIHILIAFLTVLHISNALRNVPGSPCQSVCATESVGTLEEDTVCLDDDYTGSTQGRNFERCVGCLLNSTAIDTENNETDVELGLFILRYALSSCMFGIPEERISISSPCQVTCTPLNQSIGYQLSVNSTETNPNFDFCTAGRFDDTTINNCAFCYSLIDQQLFLANFLQALHIACRQTPEIGKPFYPDAQSIFNETLLSGPSPPSVSTKKEGGLHGTALALVIALPIVGFILLLAGGCWGCFVFTRRRRRKMAATGRMSRVHNANVENMKYSPMMADKAWGETEPPREMVRLSPTTGQAQQHGPSFAQRMSAHHPPGSVVGGNEDQSTPLRSSFRDDVGPGDYQVQDPNLHEQYFGIADGGEDVAGPSGPYASNHDRPSSRHL